jgi:hypothetical protein
VDRLYAELAGAALLIIIGVGLWIHHDDVEQTKGAAECQAKVTETQGVADTEAKARNAQYDLQLAQAQKERDEAYKNLPPAIHTPVFVRLPGTICPDAPGSAPKADSVHPDTTGNGSGSGDRDIRPGIEAFKVRYSQSLLDCQQILNDWPK